MELNIVEKVIALEAVDLFAGLSPDQLSRIASIAKQGAFPPGGVISEASSVPESLHVILDGQAELLKKNERLHVAVRGDVLGAWVLFDREPMEVTARAVDDVTLLSINRDDFYDLLSDNMGITATIFSTLVRRFRKLAGT